MSDPQAYWLSAAIAIPAPSGTGHNPICGYRAYFMGVGSTATVLQIVVPCTCNPFGKVGAKA